MILHYTPCHSRKPATWSQPQPDALRCEWNGRVFECDFSQPGSVYEIPDSVREVVHSAWRDESGALNLLVPSLRFNAQIDIAIDHGASIQIGLGDDSIDDEIRRTERERIAPILEFLAPPRVREETQ